MKKLLIASLFSLSLFGNSIDKPFMTKEMLNNDLETHEYQIFFTKTNDIPLDNLSPKVIFTGKLTDYYDFFKKDMIKNLDLSTETLSSASANALKNITDSIKNNLGQITKDSLKNAGQSFGVTIILQPIAIGLIGDEHYVQVVDYYENDIPKTRVIKYIVSDEALPNEELEMIYNSTNDRSYHFNRGKTATAFSQKDYYQFRKTHNRSQQ